MMDRISLNNITDIALWTDDGLLHVTFSYLDSEDVNVIIGCNYREKVFIIINYLQLEWNEAEAWINNKAVYSKMDTYSEMTGG